MPDGFDRDAIVKLMVPEPLLVSEDKAELASVLFVKPWKAAPGLSVAVLRTETHVKGDFANPPSTFYVAVFAGGTVGGKPELKAKGSFPSARGRELKDIDLAPYRLASNTLAFGVRTSNNWPYVGGGGENDYLWLFTVDGAKVTRVWATLMHSWKMYNESMGDDGVPTKAEEGDDGLAVVSMGKSATRGFFDLRKTLGKRSAIYRWNGTEYATKGNDPVVNVNDFGDGEDDF